MIDIYLPATRQTPDISFAFSRNTLSMSGELFPENAVSFFTPLTQAVSDYLNSHPRSTLRVNFAIRYMNSASTKMIFQFMGLLNKAAAEGHNIIVDFKYDPDDDMMIEFAEDMKSDYGSIIFNMIEHA